MYKTEHEPNNLETRAFLIMQKMLFRGMQVYQSNT